LQLRIYRWLGSLVHRWFTLSLREVYHMARLRMDRHAQWDIRNVTASITALARQAAPACGILACGKDAFAQTRAAAYG